MKQKCECGEDSNTAYIYRKKGRIGEWVSIGHYCTYCGLFTPEKKIKLSQGVTATGNMNKDERKKLVITSSRKPRTR